jgi:hypothetical protein
MKTLRILLSNVELLRTGHDGGHLYLMGKAEDSVHGKTDAYCYFENKKAEQNFEESWNRSDLIITSSSWEFNRGVGLSIRAISWQQST